MMGRKTNRKGVPLSLFIAAILVPNCYAVGTYSVVAPRVIRPNRDFNVVVSLNNADGPVDITAEVGGPQDSGGSVIVNRKEAQLQPESSQVLKFQIGDLGPGSYNLTVMGTGSLIFKNTTALEYLDKSHSVFIQTDRAIYKPGDLVRFRAIVVNPELRPSVTGAIDVHVMDGDGNRVKQWNRVFTNKGVWSGSIQLSEEPVLGDWNIAVDVLGQVTKSSFRVANYILPKFEVIVDLPSYVTFEDDVIVATVKARYTYGRDLKGEVTLQVTPTYKYGYLQAPFDDPIRVVKALKGKTDIELKIKDDLKLQGDYAREIEFTAFVQEELTGRVQNASSRITVYRHPYKMELIRTSDSFKPGLKYTAFLKMARQDDTPIQEGEVTVRHAFSHDSNDFVETLHKIPPSGILTLEFFPPLDQEVLNLSLEAKYKNLTQWFADITRAQSPSNTFLQATLLTQDPMVGEEVKVNLNATQPMVYFQYEILGRGNVIFAQTLQAHDGNSHTFRFLATAAMAPQARLIVYYVKEEGEIVADSLHFTVKGAVQNRVTVSVNPKTVDVGEDVTITVTTKPRAFVGVAAIDQRSLIMSGTDHLLTQDTLLDELESYDPGRKSLDDFDEKRFRTKRSFFNWHGTTTANDVFKNAGVVLLTNGLVYDFNPLLSGMIPPGLGPIDGTYLDPTKRRPAVDGPSSRQHAPSDASTLKPDLGPGVEYNAPTRPPLAGPYAFSFLPPPPDDSPREYLNQHIPPTWFFNDAETRFNGVVSLKEKVPDSITSYIVSAFAVDDFYGLGVAEIPAKVTVFRPFFVALHLPSYVIRGEAVAVEIVVFNYGESPVEAEVTLYNEDAAFIFPDFLNELDQGSPSSQRTRNISIPKEGGASLSFMIVPQIIGSIAIKVAAKSSNAADLITQNLMVKAEGQMLTVNKPFLVDLREESSFSTSMNVSLPRNIVNGSYWISASVVGDVLGAAVSDLSNLLEIPTGCGEQNMAKLIPNIVLVEYLKKKNQLSDSLLGRATMNMMTGYQRQLTFRHKDGSFSAFGKKDKSGSTWLTAFVAKSFMAASKHVDVDLDIIKMAADWLINKQQLDGSFKEVGVINNAAIQGGATNGIPLTAYVTVALLQLRELPSVNVRNPINRALDFLATKVEEGIEDVYSLALTSYALHLANHPHTDTTFYQLEGKAKVEDEKKWWSTGKLDKTAESTATSRPLDIEMTSYMLLTYTLRSLTKDAIPILRWLTSQRNEMGGFQSTQDTAVGMAALAAIAERISPGGSLDANVRLVYGSRGNNIRVNADNALLTQVYELPEDTKSLDISASGKGTFLVQVTYHYNVQVTAPLPAFHLDPQLDRTTDVNKLRLVACTSYKSENSSNMAVMDVDLPSGYVIDNDLIPGLLDYPYVKRVEAKGKDGGVLIYFDKLTKKEVCPTVAAYRVAKVAFQKPTAVRVYDYYDLSRQARQFYEAAPATLCDICDLGECDPSKCEEQIIKLNRQQQDPDEFTYPAIVFETSSSTRIQLHILNIVVFVFIFFGINR